MVAQRVVGGAPKATAATDDLLKLEYGDPAPERLGAGVGVTVALGSDQPAVGELVHRVDAPQELQQTRPANEGQQGEPGEGQPKPTKRDRGSILAHGPVRFSSCAGGELARGVGARQAHAAGDLGP